MNLHMSDSDMAMKARRARIRKMIDPLVQGGTDAEKACGLDALAKEYAADCADSDWVERKRSPHLRWFTGYASSPNAKAQAIVQRDYLLTLDPESASLIAKMGDNLTTGHWLGVAAKKLAPYAKERIHREVEAHYRDAIEEEIVNGRSSARAHIEALRRLGDPKSVGRFFRRTYLTQKEERRLLLDFNYTREYRKSSFGEQMSWFSLLVFLFFGYVAVDGFSILFFLTASLALALFVRRGIVNPLVRSRTCERAYIWYLASIPLWMITAFCLVLDWDYLYHPVPGAIAGLILLAVVALDAYRVSFIVRKALPNYGAEKSPPPLKLP